MTEHIRIDCKAHSSPDGKAPEPPKKDGDGGDEGSCAAFGYLRGIRDSSASVEFRFRDWQQHVVSVLLARSLAVQPVRRAVAQILRRRGLPGSDPGQQPRQAACRRLDQPDERGFAALAGAVDSGDDRATRSSVSATLGLRSTAS